MSRYPEAKVQCDADNILHINDYELRSSALEHTAYRLMASASTVLTLDRYLLETVLAVHRHPAFSHYTAARRHEIISAYVEAHQKCRERILEAKE